MSHPYRSFSELKIIPNRSFLGRIRSMYRKLLILRYGKASTRFPNKCTHCRKLFLKPDIGPRYSPEDCEIISSCPKCYEIQQDNAIKNNRRLIPCPPISGLR